MHPQSSSSEPFSSPPTAKRPTAKRPTSRVHICPMSPSSPVGQRRTRDVPNAQLDATRSRAEHSSDHFDGRRSSTHRTEQREPHEVVSRSPSPEPLPKTSQRKRKRISYSDGERERSPTREAAPREYMRRSMTAVGSSRSHSRLPSTTSGRGSSPGATSTPGESSLLFEYIMVLTSES
jgi:hypothetical protein